MKTLKITVLAMVVAVSGMNIYNSQMEGGMSDAFLANVDALANEEAQPGTKCYGGYSKCYFWDCTYFPVCEIGCPYKSVDALYNESTCL